MCRKLNKFEVPIVDKTIFRKRKSKKGITKNDADKYPKTFGKSEAIFYKWFEKNKYRLNYKLIKLKSHFYRFDDVIKEIEISIALGSYLEIEFIFNYEGVCFDIDTVEYVGQEAYHPQKGYFDMDRANGIYTYYPTIVFICLNMKVAQQLIYRLQRRRIKKT